MSGKKWRKHISNLELEYKTKIDDLLLMLQQRNDILRVGQTKDPTARAKDYKRKGVIIRGKKSHKHHIIKFVGIMYYAHSKCVNIEEEKLLKLLNPPFNVQQTSNASENKDGYVYAICGIATYVLVSGSTKSRAFKRTRTCLSRDIAFQDTDGGGINHEDIGDEYIQEEEIELLEWPRDQ